MRRSISTPSDRLRSALLVVLIHVALGYALISSFGVRIIPPAFVSASNTVTA